MKGEINLSPYLNDWLEWRKQRESHALTAQRAIWTPLSWEMQYQHHLRDSIDPGKQKGERSGGKMICFTTDEGSVREVSCVLEISCSLTSSSSQTQQASSLEVLEAEAPSLAHLLLFFCLQIWSRETMGLWQRHRNGSLKTKFLIPNSVTRNVHRKDGVI